MANKTVSNLNELTTVSNSDVLLVETATETLKVTKGNLLKEVNEQLNAKSNASHTHDEYVTENELNSKGLATETFVTNKIAEASLSGGEVDLSAYATKAELNTKADKSHTHNELHSHSNKTVLDGITSSKVNEWNNKSTFNGDYNSLTNKPNIPSIEGLATEAFVEEKLAGLGSQPETLVQVSVAGNTLQLTEDKYQYSVLSSGNGISLPSVSSFAEIHLFFKTTSEITLVLPSVRWQTQPTIQANKTYEFIFTYVKDEWLGGVVEYV